MDTLPRFLTLADAADRLGVSVFTVRRWFDSGKLDGFRTPGNQRRVTLESVNRIIDGDAA